VRNIVRALTFPPVGERGMCPGLRVPGYSVTKLGGYIRHNNDNVLVIPVIETVEAVERIDEICAVEQVKLIVFAAGELGYAMGEGAAPGDTGNSDKPTRKSSPPRPGMASDWSADRCSTRRRRPWRKPSTRESPCCASASTS
jgi:hypothetical protein